MKKTLIALVLVLALLAVSFIAAAEEAPAVLGSYPERGILLSMTEEDEAMGLIVATAMASTAEVAYVPILQILYSDAPSLEAVLAKYQGVSNEDFQDEAFYMAFMQDLYSCNHALYQIALFESDFVAKKQAAGSTVIPGIPMSELPIIGENDGYTYILTGSIDEIALDDAELQARVETAAARAKALMDTLAYQPIVFAKGEMPEVPGALLPFETQDLNGNAVSNDIFSGKDLTVINIWGTYCGPCIDEMPQLAAWSAEMPENVQIIGLVSDLYSADDAETLETAKAICEATGADAYTHLIAGEDFYSLLSGVVGVPTTLFVDENGVPVAEPVVGANVPRCQQIVNDYLSTL